jgi:hypothetical protein
MKVHDSGKTYDVVTVRRSPATMAATNSRSAKSGFTILDGPFYKEYGTQGL